MTHQICIYPHNDLLNLADYHRETIKRKVSEDIDDAIALDCMSCIIALAFSVEALINLVGGKCVSSWRERAPFPEKIRIVMNGIGMACDATIDPYKTVDTLKTLRNQMAHGKPIMREEHLSSVSDFSDAMMTVWDGHLTPDFCECACAQVREFERLLMEGFRIPIDETITSAQG